MFIIEKGDRNWTSELLHLPGELLELDAGEEVVLAGVRVLLLLLPLLLDPSGPTQGD